MAVVLGIVLLLLIGVALLADVLAPFGPNEVFLMDRLQGSSARYPLGTDQLGRDFASRLIYGARLTLGVGLAATFVNVPVTLAVGGVSGFIGGRLDLTVQRFVDAWMSIPGLLILLTVMSVVGRGVLRIIVVLGVLGGIGGSRVVRGAVIGAEVRPPDRGPAASGVQRAGPYSVNVGRVVVASKGLTAHHSASTSPAAAAGRLGTHRGRRSRLKLSRSR